MDDSAKIQLPNSSEDETSGPTPADERQTTHMVVAPAQEDGEEDQDPIAFVEDYLRDNRLEILYDGSVADIAAQSSTATKKTVSELLAQEAETVSDLIDRMVIFARAGNLPFQKSIISTACRRVVRQAKIARRITVLRPLIEPELSDAEMAKSRAEWARVGALFDLEPSLSVAVIQHFMWQVKRKSLNKDIKHHLMPIVWSSTQGSGKTTFVKGLVGPLRELASFTYLSDIADTRSEEIFRFPAVVVDDMAPEKGVAILKSRITGEKLTGRRMNTSFTSSYRMRSTFIGTANTTIQELVRDETGSRRFAMLPFRNGSVQKGGSPLIWPIVESLDHQLLWRSVSATGPSPILDVLDQLIRHQGQFVPESPVVRWMKGLDFTSEELQEIRYKAGVLGEELRQLFMKQTRESISTQAFSAEILKNCDDPAVPFAKRQKVDKGALYVLKSSFAKAATPNAVVSSSAVFSPPSDPSDPPASPAPPVREATLAAAHLGPAPLDADAADGSGD
ncbi:primase-helicase family protein [Mesorhizobium sp.]|uniref:primase-helicase family protein n=1 Tax=Mesorhizobium sp. TaxID=1871066 RepID=UPI000FE5F4A1|nr:primase-helicase family protein [Mesorhizobium sp.]RWD98348.1 MAG: hypothetical protein EOS40_24520 [Mesorhizobium sp.]